MKSFLIALALAFAGLAFGQATDGTAPGAANEERLKALANELRCLVCQNQTIADSNASLAVDLRQQIRTQIADGRTDEQILAYMVQRYGEFVLYRPSLNATTALLWLGPFALVAGGVLLFIVIVRKRRKAAPETQIAPERREALRELLEKD